MSSSPSVRADSSFPNLEKNTINFDELYNEARIRVRPCCEIPSSRGGLQHPLNSPPLPLDVLLALFHQLLGQLAVLVQKLLETKHWEGKSSVEIAR